MNDYIMETLELEKPVTGKALGKGLESLARQMSDIFVVKFRDKDITSNACSMGIKSKYFNRNFMLLGDGWSIDFNNRYTRVHLVTFDWKNDTFYGSQDQPCKNLRRSLQRAKRKLLENLK